MSDIYTVLPNHSTQHGVLSLQYSKVISMAASEDSLKCNEYVFNDLLPICVVIREYQHLLSSQTS